MSACDALVDNASQGVSVALRAVDCMANETAASTFARLFGGQGALLPALTILLTLYIVIFAIGLLTGRSSISLSSLTPRMLTLGLVLTFATSWAAYQSVVWNLATGAPDELAGVLLGAKGSATQVFGDRIDLVMGAIADAASQGQQGAGQSQAAEGAAQQAVAAQASTFSPRNLLWLSDMILLLGTVGVLLTARIALAVLLAIGPAFIVLALFNGTRGLFVGWVRGLVMMALVPLFVVVGGAITLQLTLPLIARLTPAQGIDGRVALGLFLIASVHAALMSLAMKVATMPALIAQNAPQSAYANTNAGHASSRMAAIAAIPVMMESGASEPASMPERRLVIQNSTNAAEPVRSTPNAGERTRGVGSAFRSPTSPSSEIMR
ncbi:MAG: hypothetical protein ABT11_20360 [Novosphingobium sp. SCN 66-18]|nr:MAG: hypothetical protein ABT11_20360 [Novosphingobium sp. SCN 66-18]